METSKPYSASLVSLDPAEATDDVSVFVNDYETTAEIGLFDSERGRRQRLRFNVDAGCHYGSLSDCQTRAEVVCYKSIVDQIEAELGLGHVDTVETLADRLSARILADTRVLWVTLKIEKLDAVEGAASVGIRVTRRRPSKS